jgi:HK97 family phage major capsid protein
VPEVASVEEQIKDMNNTRMRIWEQGKEILDRALEEGRSMSAEEKASFDEVNADIKRIDETRKSLLESAQADREYHEINDELRKVTTPIERNDQQTKERRELESFFRRQIRSDGVDALDVDLRPVARIYNAYRAGARGEELRVLAGDTGSSGGSLTIPTTVASTVYAYMTAQVAMRRMNTTVFTTAAGNALSFPRVASHAAATQVATQDTAFAGTDPVLGQMQLNAYDAGELVAVANDLLEDSGVDLLGFIGRQLGRSIGQLTAQWYVSGTGSGQPQGVMTSGANGGAGTVATGGSLILGASGQVLEKLIDLQYSVVDSYRTNGAEWLMRDLTGATIRKIRDGAGGTVGQFVWQPSPTVGLIGGQPDTFLGDPVFFDPNVASMASDAKVIAYGDFSAYYIRDVSGFRLERSDDLLFNKNQVAFRGLLRTDGDLIDTNAINILHQAVS